MLEGLPDIQLCGLPGRKRTFTNFRLRPDKNKD